MEIKTGYLYHIKDEFFELVNDENLMANHEYGKKRPTYFTIRDKEILWFIPLSSKVDKYKRIIDNKINKYGFCNTIMIEKILENDSVVLLQNSFPTLEKYIDHVHTYNDVPAKVSKKIEQKIIKNFNEMLKMKKRGINLFFTDIDSLKKRMLEEIKKE